MERTVKRPRRKAARIVQAVKNLKTGKLKFIVHKFSTLQSFNLNAITEGGCSLKTESRKRERNRSVLVWDSEKKGTYVREKHGEL